MRIDHHPILENGKKLNNVTIRVDGVEVEAREGEPIAAALAAAGIRVFRRTRKRNEPRRIFCAVGRCTDCVMTVNGLPNVRTCVTPVRDGMEIWTQQDYIPGTTTSIQYLASSIQHPASCIEIAVIGGGPAGLAAAVEARRYGAQVTIIDENQRPGGQLFKQIHKFFGSQEHRAGVRGYSIGKQLLQDCRESEVDVMLETVVWGIFENNRMGLADKNGSSIIKADKIILAAGASENPLAFPGWTLPGVMGAGAVQTMMNVHRVLPGQRVLMIGSGNVGLIVAYQLLQAGAEVLAVLDAAPRLGGYFVHAAKLLRSGVPILTSHTVAEARGVDGVEEAVVVALDDNWQPVAGTEKTFLVDLICIAVGLSPEADLCRMAGCQLKYLKELGGHVPIHNERMKTSVPGLYVAGDMAGIEEASSAMEEGRLAGLAAAEALGYISESEFEERARIIRRRLASLRMGAFGEIRHKAKQELVSDWSENSQQISADSNADEH